MNGSPRLAFSLLAVAASAFFNFFVCLPLHAQGWADGEHDLFVGASMVDVTPPVGVPLAGFSGGKRRFLPFDIWGENPYAHYLAPSEGVRDPIRAKALVMERDGAQLVFVSVDLVAASRTMRADLVDRLADILANEDALMLSATHTHSGPGALTDNFFWALYVADRFEPEIYDFFMDGVERAVRQAYETRRPAQLLTWQAEIPNVQRNRRQDRDPVDRAIRLIGAKDREDRWIGVLANFAIHPVAYGPDSGNLFSADLAGGIERAIAERLAPHDANPLPVLFVNGAVGDVSPSGNGQRKLLEISDAIADATLAASTRARALKPDWSIRRTTVSLETPQMSFLACANSTFWRSVLWDGLGIPLAAWLPDESEITVVELGNLALVTWPGEATAAIGRMVGDAADGAGFADTILLGLTNDYLHYFTTPEEYVAGGYEACNDFYGAAAGETIVAAIRSLLKGG